MRTSSGFLIRVGQRGKKRRTNLPYFEAQKAIFAISCRKFPFEKQKLATEEVLAVQKKQANRNVRFAPMRFAPVLAVQKKQANRNWLLSLLVRSRVLAVQKKQANRNDCAMSKMTLTVLAVQKKQANRNVVTSFISFGAVLAVQKKQANRNLNLPLSKALRS